MIDSVTQGKLQQVHQVVSHHLQQIQKLLPHPRFAITFLARNTEVPDADILLTVDELPKAAAAITALHQKGDQRVKPNTPDPRQAPLKVVVAGGQLTINIGVDALLHAIRFSQYFEHLAATNTIHITDPDAFMAEILRQLQVEEEDGTTLVHRCLDKAAEDAVEYGAEGIELLPPGDSRFGKVRVEPPREYSVAELKHRFPRVMGVSRDAEDPRTLLVAFVTKPSDDELRAVHTFLGGAQ